MANTKASALTELAADPTAGDWLIVVDVSDTTHAASGTTKKLNTNRVAFVNTVNSFTANQSVTGLVSAEHFRTRSDTIADDGVISFTPNQNIGAIIVTTSLSGATYSGLLSYRAAASGHCTVLAGGAGLASAGTVVLTGTTGTDARLNFSSAPDGTIYVENRTGFSNSVRITCL